MTITCSNPDARLIDHVTEITQDTHDMAAVKARSFLRRDDN